MAKLLAVSLVILFSSTGCAFGIYGLASKGKTQAVYFDTEPQGALITIEGMRCETPCQLELLRKDDHTAIIRLEGYKTRTVYLTKEADGAVLAFDGVLMPYLLGTANDISPRRNFITLVKEEKPQGGKDHQ